MATVTMELDEELVALLQGPERPAEAAARELIVLELYRQGTVSSGKAAELLGMPRVAFIQHASGLGIPYYRLTREDWEAEQRTWETL